MLEEVAQVLAQKQISRLGNLGIMVSRRCNIECSHCITVSSPKIRDYPPSHDIESLIREAANLRDISGMPQSISFTGGEPLLLKKDLQAWSRLAVEFGFKVGIVTNAFWARTLKSARETLNQFRHIYAFDVSTDMRHLQFIPLETVENAIKELAEAGKLGAVRFVRQDGDQHFFDVIQQVVDKYAINRLVTSTLITLDKVGKPILTKERQSDQIPNIPCMSMSPLVTPSSRVIACCGPLVNAKENHPLVLGDLSSDNLQTIYSNLARNPIAHALRIGGISTLLEILEFLNHKSFTTDFYDPQDPCFSCFNIVTNISLRDFQNLCANPGIQARLAMLRFVILGEEEGIDLLTDDAFSQIGKEFFQLQQDNIAKR